jgi:hypothetical protein
VFPRPDRIIVPQYEPTPGLSLVAAAELLGESRRAVAAQLVDLAVRGVVVVSRQKRGFVLELARPEALADPATAPGQDERDILHAFFGGLTPGARRELRRGANRELGAALRDQHRRVVARLVLGNLARERSWLERAVVFWRKQPTEPTSAAHPAVDHLWGIHDYVELAEKDRFAMLQSPAGALTEPRGELEILRLHERLLPYAVLFGLEKAWMRELDVRYRSLPPDVVENLGTVMDVAEVAVHGVALAIDLAELATVVDLGDAADGLGAFFGGLGEVLSNIDLPDIDF